MAEKLKNRREYVDSYYENENLFLFKNENAKTDAYYEIVEELYQREYNEELYYKISQIPFHLIISISPDLFLPKTFEKFGLPYNFHYFQKDQTQQNIPEPTKDSPLIYNLFGSIDDQESLILDHDDLFDYLSAILGKNKLPQVVQNTLSNAKTLIFFGFDLNKWYIQLLLRLLNLSKDKDNFKSFALGTNTNKRIEEFCLKHFNIIFVSAIYKLTEKTLNILREKNIHPKHTEQLENLRGKNYITGTRFLKDIEDTIDVESINNYKSLILKQAFIPFNYLNFINSLFEKYKKEGISKEIQKEILMPEKQLRPQIFISYAWGETREKIVNEIYNIMIAKGYNVIRDKMSLAYKGNIKEFMQRIGKGKYVILVISDKYLKSENCMYEVLQIKQNEDIYDRIYPIVLSDAKIYKPANQLDYVNYWDKKIALLNEKIKNTQNQAYINEKSLDQYNDIRRIISDFMALVSNMNTLTPDMHRNENFESLIKAIDKKFEEDLSLLIQKEEDE
jgi:hypothetical protein